MKTDYRSGSIASIQPCPDMSALPPTAVELVRFNETTRCSMCGRIWTPPDCNGVRHVEDQGPQLLTYIRLPDAAYVDAASLDGFSPAHLNGAKILAEAMPVHTPGSGSDGVTAFTISADRLQWLGRTSLALLPRRSGVLRPVQPSGRDRRLRRLPARHRRCVHSCWRARRLRYWDAAVAAAYRASGFWDPACLRLARARRAPHGSARCASSDRHVC